MDIRKEWKKLLAIAAVFLAFFYLPMDWTRIPGGIMESLHLAEW